MIAHEIRERERQIKYDRVSQNRDKPPQKTCRDHPEQCADLSGQESIESQWIDFCDRCLKDLAGLLRPQVKG